MQLVGDRRWGEGRRIFRSEIVHDSPAWWHWHWHLCLYEHVYVRVNGGGARWINPMGLLGSKESRFCLSWRVWTVVHR